MNRSALWIVLLSLLSLAVTPLWGQNGNGNFTGHVTDTTGALVEGATVTALNVATGVRTSVTTNNAGIFLLQNLIPGIYSIEVAKTGFKKLQRPNTLVQVSDNLGVDFRLEVGTVSETLTITAQTPQLRTEDAKEGEVINETMIQTLPTFSNSGLARDPLSLLSLSGNVQGTSMQGSNGTTRAGWSIQVSTGNFTTASTNDTRVNGGAIGGLEFLVDGVPITGGLVHNVFNSAPTEDDVQEFKVITNGMDAEYGRLSGGAVELTTKSGSNGIHGQLFEYHQDEFFNANTWSNDGQCASGIKTSCSKPLFHQNDFGFAVGGPVRIPHVYNGRDRTFWFANAEWTRWNNAGANQIGQTITDQERNSIPNPLNGWTIANPFPCAAQSSTYVNPDPNLQKYAGDCANLEDIGTTPNPGGVSNPNPPSYPYPYLGDVYNVRGANGSLPLAGGDGRSIPVQELNSTALWYLALLPKANLKSTIESQQPGNNGLGTGGNYLFNQPQTINNLSWNVRIDEAFSNSKRVFGRFAHYSATETQAGEYPNFAYNGTKIKGAFSASLHYDQTFSPTLILSLIIGGSYNPFAQGSFVPSNSPATNNGSLGLAPSITSILGTQTPTLKIAPFTEGNSTPNVNGNLNATTNQVDSFANTEFNYSAALTKVLNRHTLKFGYESRRYYDDYATAAGSNPGGNGDGYAFANAGIDASGQDLGGGWNPQYFANGLGNFLYGMTSWTQLTNTIERNLAHNYYATFIQDDFKVTRKLTLNLGLRWEMESPVTDRANNISVWDPLASSPFTLNPAYSNASYVGTSNPWISNLEAAGLTPAQAAKVPAPAWFTNQTFFPGAQEFVYTPEHRSRNATSYHPWNFAPRLGFAYQVMPKTVLRGSFGIFYLPTGGNLQNYGDGPGIAYATQYLSTADHPADYNFNPATNSLAQTMTNPFPNPATDFLTFTHNNHIANVQTAANANGTGGVLITSHMPHEYDWHFGIQQQLPNRWMLEVDYSGKSSNTQLADATPSRFPKSLYTPHNGGIYGTGDPTNNLLCSNGQNPAGGAGSSCYTLTSPTAGQIPPGSATGPTQPLSWLMFPYPYFGPVFEENANIGTNNFNAGNLRIERRFANGFQMTFNYTYSKSLDDFGAVNGGAAPSSGGVGQNGKSWQGVDSISSVYGLSAGDQTHRITAFGNYQLPFGRGRRWGTSPQGLDNKILDDVIGGWELSGTFTWLTGTPISINGSGNGNVDGPFGIYGTFTNLLPGYSLSQVVNQGVSAKAAACPSVVNCSDSVAKSALNPNVFANGGSQTTFTYGNVPPVIPYLREPSVWDSNMSIMKNFAFSSDGHRYFQLRLEGENIFNHPGLKSYDTSLGSPTYGLITSKGANGARQVQIAGKIVF